MTCVSGCCGLQTGFGFGFGRGHSIPIREPRWESVPSRSAPLSIPIPKREDVPKDVMPELRLDASPSSSVPPRKSRSSMVPPQIQQPKDVNDDKRALPAPVKRRHSQEKIA